MTAPQSTNINVVATEKWEELPSCPYNDSGLVVIDRELTAAVIVILTNYTHYGRGNGLRNTLQSTLNVPGLL